MGRTMPDTTKPKPPAPAPDLAPPRPSHPRPEPDPQGSNATRHEPDPEAGRHEHPDGGRAPRRPYSTGND